MVYRGKNKKHEIDQSGKIEQTNKITVIAFSNASHGSIKLAAKDKRYLQNIYRRAGKSKSYTLQVFQLFCIYYLRNLSLKKSC